MTCTPGFTAKKVGVMALPSADERKGMARQQNILKAKVIMERLRAGVVGRRSFVEERNNLREALNRAGITMAELGMNNAELNVLRGVAGRKGAAAYLAQLRDGIRDVDARRKTAFSLRQELGTLGLTLDVIGTSPAELDRLAAA